MSDLPTRLREQWEPGGDIYAAADEIERLRELMTRADYYINRLEAAHRGHVVRDLDEAHTAWESFKLRGPHQQQGDKP